MSATRRRQPVVFLANQRAASIKLKVGPTAAVRGAPSAPSGSWGGRAWIGWDR